MDSRCSSAPTISAISCWSTASHRCLRPGARVVALSSSGHRFADVDLGDPNFERADYDPWVAYGRSKTADILFAVEFDRRHRGRNVRATAVHPGGIQTELARHLDPEAIAKMVANINAAQAAQGKPPFQFKTIPQGAATSVWAGVVAPADQVGGTLLRDCHVTTLVTGSAGRSDERWRPALCTRCGACRGALGQERGTGGRTVLIVGTIAAARPCGWCCPRRTRRSGSGWAARP